MRTPRLHLGQTSITLETSIGISLESRPPWGFFWLGRMCLYTRLIPSTTILLLEAAPAAPWKTAAVWEFPGRRRQSLRHGRLYEYAWSAHFTSLRFISR